MRFLTNLSLFCLLLAVAISCTSSLEDDPQPNDAANLITGTYQFTTYRGGSETGSGTAIISREGNNSIRVGLQDGVSFYANKLQRVDNDMIMEVPSQTVDYYGMQAQFVGQQQIDRQGQRYQGVYFGSNGELRMSLQLTVGSQQDQILLLLDR